MRGKVTSPNATAAKGKGHINGKKLACLAESYPSFWYLLSRQVPSQNGPTLLNCFVVSPKKWPPRLKAFCEKNPNGLQHGLMILPTKLDAELQGKSLKCTIHLHQVWSPQQKGWHWMTAAFNLLSTCLAVTKGCFQKSWYPQIVHFNRVFHFKPSILGYPYFWKHPYDFLMISSAKQFFDIGKSLSNTPQFSTGMFWCLSRCPIFRGYVGFREGN